MADRLHLCLCCYRVLQPHLHRDNRRYSLHWFYVDNSCILSCLQSGKISSESNSKSIWTAKRASDKSTSWEEVRLEQHLLLCPFSRLLSPFLLLGNIASRWHPAKISCSRSTCRSVLRCLELVIKSCSLLLAISRNSWDYENQTEKNIAYWQDLNWNECQITTPSLCSSAAVLRKGLRNWNNKVNK